MARDYLIALAGGIKMLFPGVGFTEVDVKVERADGETYRDLMGADVFQRSILSPTRIIRSTASNLGSPTPPTIDSEDGITDKWNLTVIDGSSARWDIGGLHQVKDDYFEEDDRFNHEPPRHSVKQVDYRRFYVDNTKTELIGEVPLHLIRGMTSSAADPAATAYVQYV